MVTSYGHLKFGENESPPPQNRVFLSCNYNSEVLDSDYHRGTLGFEKTIHGGEASIGLGVPTDNVLPVMLFNDIGIGWN